MAMTIIIFFTASISVYFLCSYIEHVFKAISSGTLHTGLPTNEYFDFLSDFRLGIAIFFFVLLLLFIFLGMPVPSI